MLENDRSKQEEEEVSPGGFQTAGQRLKQRGFEICDGQAVKDGEAYDNLKEYRVEKSASLKLPQPSVMAVNSDGSTIGSTEKAHSIKDSSPIRKQEHK